MNEITNMDLIIAYLGSLDEDWKHKASQILLNREAIQRVRELQFELAAIGYKVVKKDD